MYLTIGSYDLMENLAPINIDDQELRKVPYTKLRILMDVLEQGYSGSVIDMILTTDPGFLVKAEITMFCNKMRLRDREHTVDIYDMADIPTLNNGVLYGYPECCIQWFHGRTMLDIHDHQPTAFDGTGFIPCPKCRERDEAEVLNDIASRRVTPIPFPDGESSDELELIAWLKYLKQPLGENLKLTEAHYPNFDYNKLLVL